MSLEINQDIYIGTVMYFQSIKWMAISTSVVYYRVLGNACMYGIRLNIKMNIKVAYVLIFYDSVNSSKSTKVHWESS